MNRILDSLSQQQIAEAHQVSTRTVRTWQRSCFPVNADRTYSLAATIRWRIEHECMRRYGWFQA